MADVNIQIEVEGKQAQKSLNKIEGALGDISNQTKKLTALQKKQAAASKKAATLRKKEETERVGRIKNITTALVGVAAAAVAVGRSFSFVVDQAIVMEDLNTQFIAFTGSAEAAADQVARIAKLSASTPFQLEDLANANRTLLAFGSSTEESIEQLTQLGEAAAATGNNVGDLAVIFGQIQAATKLSSERFNQLVERGVNIGPTIAKSLGVAESELLDMRAAGKITADDVKKAFELMTTDGGIFAGSMERQSKTLSGSFSTLKDNISLLAADIGSELTPALTSAANALSGIISSSKEFRGLSERGKEIERLALNVEVLNEKAAEVKKEGVGVLDAIFGQSEASVTAEIDARIAALSGQIAELKELEAADQAKKAKEVDSSGGVDKEAEKRKQAEAVAAQELKEAQEKIDAELLVLRQRKSANLAVLAKTESEQKIKLLNEEAAKISEKTLELETQRLELKGQFNEAAELQAQTHQDNLLAIEEAARQERKAKAAKERADFFNFDKKDAEAKEKFEEQNYKQRVQTAQKGLNALASLQKTGSKEAFEVGKAASIAQALVSIPTTAIEAYKSLAGIPGVGPALGAAAAAAAVAAGTAQVNQIRSQQFTAFAGGGLAEGGIPGKDSIPSLLQDGEVVVPQKNFESLNFNNDQQIVLLNKLVGLLSSDADKTQGAAEVEAVESEPLTVNLVMNEEILATQMLEISRDNLRTA